VIDLRRLREDPEYRRGIERKRVRAGVIDEVLGLDQVRRKLASEVDGMRARQNAASAEIGKAAPEERQAKIHAAGELKLELAAQDEALREVDTALRELALQLPNPADPSVPDGGEDEGEVRKVVGETPEAPTLDHAAFGEALGLVDTVHAAEASGSRFAYLMREAALLELALVNYAMETITRHGFVPVVTPALVRERTMEEAGFFPTDRAQVYEVDNGELFLLGTSEVALSALHRGDTFTADQLPARYAGYSTCFRREAGTYGKDTRGIFRVHQFDKLELFSYCHPDSSWDEHERLLEIEEEIAQELGFHYRVQNIPVGDLGASAAKKFDIEVWLPGQQRYRELTSCSNCTDYQARRLDVRYRTDSGPRHVHMLNGTAITSSRTLLAVIEYGQQEDGSVHTPEPLHAFGAPAGLSPR